MEKGIEISTNTKFAQLMERLKELNLPVDQFAVMGSGPMAARGWRVPGDFDLVVSKKLFSQLAQKYPVIDSWHGGKIKLVEGANPIDVYNSTAAPTRAEELIARADIFDGIRFVSLEDTVVAKRAEGREKDLKDVEIIEKYIKDQPTK